MVQENPFSESFRTTNDSELVQQALAGNRKALNDLLSHHNPFIYNIALKMLGSIEDAKDLTQDVLIKLITNLSSYDSKKAQFRTWVYRITFNYILNYKKSKTEKMIINFSQFFEFIDQVEDEPLEDINADLLSEEMKLKCMSGVLMCIPRENRLLYIMGDLFKIGHKLGAELFHTTPANFRKKLSRIRGDLRQWLNNKCGLVNKDNPCRCAKKTKGFIKRGIVDPDNLVWDKGFTHRIEDYVSKNLHENLRTSDMIYSHLYQKHPFKKDLTGKEIIDEILKNKNLSEMLSL